MSKELSYLLAMATALSLDLTDDDPKLSAAIEAVEALGDDANMDSPEAKELMTIVESLGESLGDKSTPKKEKTMSKALVELLATATDLSLTVNNPKLSAAIEAVEALGDNGNMSAPEAKELKTIVESLSEDEGDEGDKTPKENKPTPKERLNYAGVKQIGSLWYCKEDNYKKSFATADECAKHFNG